MEAQIAKRYEDGSPTVSGIQPVEYNGKKYRRNTAVKAILCIGVDTSGQMEEQEISGTAGQADGVFLIARDDSRNMARILMIPRDTMTEITLFDLAGNVLGKDTQHITLAFAYGDGKVESCKLMADAVSHLMGGLSIDGYMAMNMTAISELNDLVGGITVTIEDEGLEQRDPELVKGSTVTLDGTQAELFVRHRDVDIAQSAIRRMDNQKQYITSYVATAQEAAQKDEGLVTRLMNIMQKHMITNMAKDQYMDMAMAVLNSRETMEEEDILMVPGEVVETVLYDEYHPDREALQQMVLELFYREVS